MPSLINECNGRYDFFLFPTFSRREKGIAPAAELAPLRQGNGLGEVEGISAGSIRVREPLGRPPALNR